MEEVVCFPIEIKKIIPPLTHAQEQPVRPPPQKKKNIPPPFSPLGAFLDADDDDNDEDTNKGSNSWPNDQACKIINQTATRNKTLKQSSLNQRGRSSLSRASICGGIACPFPLFCRSNSDVYVPNVKGIPLSSKRFSQS
ncbi:hypothetical protein D5086_030952 [Populus alba]|uniref:Uncharacterized protein n=1 Tax=Populus alba TaxID=43335 RepID=A0ACC4AQ48_POPAL